METVIEVHLCAFGIGCLQQTAIDQKAEHAVTRTVCFSQSLSFFFASMSACFQGRVLTLYILFTIHPQPPSSPAQIAFTLFVNMWKV